jgi:hypothetical protein
MGTRRVIAAVAALAALVLATALLAGCAADTDGTPTPGGTVTEPSTGPTPGAAGPTGPTPGATGPTAGATGPGRPTPSRLPPIPVTPAPTAGAELTLTGVVIEGVEPNCLLLESPGGQYLLVAQAGVDRSLIRAGARITVRGRVAEGLMSTCQQGTPFLVSDARPA